MIHIPRKRFGQHFLADRAVLAALVAAIAPRPGDRLVEIGPGLGALTERLLALLERIDAVEIDRDLVARLSTRFGDRLGLHAVDALRFDFGLCAPPGERSLRVVGNLPYNISTPLLVHLLGWRDRVLDQHFMLQKEVVDRIVAKPHSRDFGRLTVLLQAFYEVESLFEVPPEAFDPPPRVDSAVVRMRPRADPELEDPAMLERLLAAAFSQRRKMLRSTLLPWLASQGLSDERLAQVLELDPTARPEDLSVADYGAIARALDAAPPAISRNRAPSRNPA